MAGELRHSTAGLYVLKALCAIAVIAIHAPVGNLRAEVNVLASLAVPLFLCITGYFLYAEDSQVIKARLQKTFRKLVPIIFVTQFIYLFYPNTFSLWGHSSSFYIKWLLVGMNHKQVHLWYLHALFQALLLFYWLGRRAPRAYAVLGLVFLLLHFYLSGYVFTKSSDVYWSNPWCYWFRYVWATAMPYIGVGMMIRRYEFVLTRFLLKPRLWSLVFIVLLYANTFFTALYAPNVSIFFKPILQVVAVILIFVGAMYYSIGSRVGQILSFIGQHLSADIYYWHIFVLWLVSKSLRYDVYQVWAVLPTFILAMLLAYSIHIIKRKFLIQST